MGDREGDEHPASVAPFWTNEATSSGPAPLQRPDHGPPGQGARGGAERGSVPPRWYVHVHENPVPNWVVPVPFTRTPSGVRVPVNVPPVPVQTVLE